MVFQAIEFQLRYTLRHSRNVDGGVFALGIQIAAPLSQFAPILPGRKLRAFFLWYSESLALTQVECWEFVPSRYFIRLLLDFAIWTELLLVFARFEQANCFRQRRSREG
ncbi:MAG TPA: hypothetical protein VL976_07300 [Xanthobacteraceae bacterium]|nr:hypothetical protein [Xanthobacteraceae bacterium]